MPDTAWATTAELQQLIARVEEIERRQDIADDLKAELANWIGEAKRYERLWRSADEKATRWFAELQELRAAADRSAGEGRA